MRTRKLKNNTKYKKLQCAPIQYNKLSKKLKSTTCYDDERLFALKKYWNDKYPNNKIREKKPINIWKSIKNNIGNVCKDERCWLRHEFMINNVKDKTNENIFRPVMPKEWKNKPYMWLNNIDITKIMKQYEKAYNYFKFIGPSPIDFDFKISQNKCVWNELCNFNINNYEKNKITKIGIILNLDKHYNSGSHWVTLFIDLNKKFIFYFDSNGIKPPKEVDIFANRIIEQYYNRKNINLEYINNNRFVHQQKDGTCGIYAIYCIVELLLEKKTPYFFKTRKVSDYLMRDYRKIYYNDEY